VGGPASGPGSRRGRSRPRSRPHPRCGWPGWPGTKARSARTGTTARWRPSTATSTWWGRCTATWTSPVCWPRGRGCSPPAAACSSTGSWRGSGRCATRAPPWCCAAAATSATTTASTPGSPPGRHSAGGRRLCDRPWRCGRGWSRGRSRAWRCSTPAGAICPTTSGCRCRAGGCGPASGRWPSGWRRSGWPTSTPSSGVDPEQPQAADLAVGDLVGLGVSHPCTTFDKWRMLLLVDDDDRVTGAVRTLF